MLFLLESPNHPALDRKSVFLTCNFTPNFPSMLNKKDCQFRHKFWEMTHCNQLTINAIAYLSWTKDCGSSSCLADKIEPIGACQNDLKIYPRRQQFTAKANLFSMKISIFGSNKYFSYHCVNAVVVHFIKPCLNVKLCRQYQIN